MRSERLAGTASEAAIHTRKAAHSTSGSASRLTMTGSHAAATGA
jgi:hypothetical protein